MGLASRVLGICEGAKAEGYKTLVVCQKGRDATYSRHYKSRERGGKEIGVVDETMVLERFREVASNQSREALKARSCLFVPNRSFAVYVGYDAIEKEFDVPVLGNKYLLRAEERDAPRNQYHLMEKAGVRMPKKVKRPEDIDRPTIVKVNEAKRSYERAFFLCSSHQEYLEHSRALIDSGKILEEDLSRAAMEEYILGAHFNLNFFYSPLSGELELLGIDTRRQTNIDGYLRAPADVQLELLKNARPSTIEVGHISCTLRESLLEGAFDIGERFVEAVAKEYKPGIIGPFALQGAFVEEGREEFVCFDVSLRMPGSPGTRFTPYPGYLHRESVSFGRRLAMEVKEAERSGKIDLITT